MKMNLFSMLLSPVKTAQMINSDLTRDNYLYKNIRILLLGIIVYTSNLIPGVNAECALVSPMTECSSVTLLAPSSQLNYTAGSALDLSLDITTDCANLSKMLEDFSQTSFSCSSSKMLLINSISHTPHRNGLLKVNSIQEDRLNMEFMPSNSLSDNFQLSLSLKTINYCYTLIGEDCQDSCVQGCKNIKSNMESTTSSQEINFEFFVVEPTPKFGKFHMAILFFVVLTIFVLLILVLFILKKRGNNCLPFWSNEDKRRYLGSDATADKSKLENIS